MSEYGGKEKRVLGTFVLMIGSGIVLESAVWWPGVILMALGLGTLLWGGLAARPQTMHASSAMAPSDAEGSR
jgi:hypothetical protein